MNQERRWWYWLLPNRFDAVMTVIAVLVFAGFLFSTLSISNPGSEEAYLTAGMLVASSLIGIACCLSWWTFGTKRMLLLLSSCFLSLFAFDFLIRLFGWQWINDDLPMQNSGFMGYGYLESESNKYWLFGGLLVGFLVNWLLIVLFRYVPGWIFSGTQRIFRAAQSRLEITRVKMLVGVAGTLFVLATLNNILIANGLNIFDGGVGNEFSFVSAVIGLLISLAAYGILIVWTSWALLRCETLWVKLLALIVLVLAAAFAAFSSQANSYMNIPIWVWMSWFGVCGLVFVLSIIGLKPAALPPRPSIWSTLPLSFSALILMSPLFFDFSYFFLSQTSGNLPVKFESALQSGQTKWRTDGQISGTPQRYYCRFKPDATADLLDTLDTSSGTINLSILEIHPRLETELLGQVSKGFTSLIDTHVTAKQLEDITRGTTQYCVIKNLDVDSTKSKAVIDAPAKMLVQEDRPGKLTQFLDSIDSFNKTPEVTIQAEVTSDDLPAIIRASQTCRIVLENGPPGDVADWSRFKDELGNIQVIIGGYDSLNQSWKKPLTKKQFRFLTDTNVKILTKSYNVAEQIEWDLAFSRPERFEFQNTYNNIAQLANQYHRDKTVFQRHHLEWKKDGSGEISHLYLPYGEYWDGVANLKSLKVLSYDPDWLSESFSSPIAIPPDLGFLSSLTNLEELYFSDNTLPNLNFLLTMKSLKHVQIPATSATLGDSGLDSCPSLESVTFLGKPDKQAVSQLTRLPNLKKVTISDIYNAPLDAKTARLVLEKKLPGVKIVIMPFGKHQPDIPAAFVQHKLKAQAEIKARLKELTD